MPSILVRCPHTGTLTHDPRTGRCYEGIRCFNCGTFGVECDSDYAPACSHACAAELAEQTRVDEMLADRGFL